jgi:hypothetical protein
MKPAPQNSSNRDGSRDENRTEQKSHPFPATDYNFHGTEDVIVASSTGLGKKFIKLDTFRKSTTEFLDMETHRDFFAELFLFTIITGVSAWPIMSMVIAVTRMVRGW